MDLRDLREQRQVRSMAGLGLLVVLVLILVCVPLWALIWGQKERRPQDRQEDLANFPRLDPLEGRPEKDEVAIANDAPEPRSSKTSRRDRARPARSLPASRSCRA
jgi:hypothetical protein